MILIALTGWGQDEDRRRSQEAGFNFHVVKPVELIDKPRTYDWQSLLAVSARPMKLAIVKKQLRIQLSLSLPRATSIESALRSVSTGRE